PRGARHGRRNARGGAGSGSGPGPPRARHARPIGQNEPPMDAQVEQLADDRVRLTVEVPAHDVNHAIEHATHDLAGRVKVPGFRPGKVPPQVLMSTIGKERLYSGPVAPHTGNWFWNAVLPSRVRPAEQPEYDYVLPSSPKEDWRFTAEFAVQPRPEPYDWKQLEVPRREVEVPEETVTHELE